MTTQEIRERAAQLIEERGWWDGGKPSRSGGEICLLQAIHAACLEDIESLEDDLDTAAKDEIRRECAVKGSLGRWNDSHTKADVLAALRGTYVAE